MEKVIIKTDKRYRRNLFTVYLILIVIGVVVVKWGIPAFRWYLVELPPKPMVETVETSIHIVLMLFIPAAAYLIFVGRKICIFKAMPYPGMKVIHDTVVVTGKKALVRGWSLMILGAIMILMVIVSSIITHQIILRLKHTPIIRPIFYGTEV
jgi:hypothetical protein